MRFEIGPGGMLVILLGLAGLSGAVFGLGMVAGHELSGPEPGSQPVAAAYPLPAAAPASVPSVAAEASAPVPAAPANAKAAAEPNEEAAGTETTTAAANPPAKPAVASAPPLKSAASAPATGAHAARKRATSNTSVASRASPGEAADEDLSTGAAVAPPAETDSEPAEAGGAGDEGEEEAAPAAPAPHRRLAAVNPAPMRAASGPYSVQIDAMMDRSGAEEMAQKMRAKGFEPYIVPTLIDGKTWYRLRVGHYATPEQAQAAESKLHQDFDHTPTGN